MPSGAALRVVRELSEHHCEMLAAPRCACAGVPVLFTLVALPMFIYLHLTFMYRSCMLLFARSCVSSRSQPSDAPVMRSVRMRITTLLGGLASWASTDLTGVC